jgi:hypothetical protein
LWSVIAGRGFVAEMHSAIAPPQSRSSKHADVARRARAGVREDLAVLLERDAAAAGDEDQREDRGRAASHGRHDRRDRAA